MCCANKRAARHGARGHRGTGSQFQHLNSGVIAIMNALNDIKLANHGIDSKIQTGYLASQQPVVTDTQFGGVERGVVTDPEKDEKALQSATIAFEELPSYEASAGIPASQPGATQTHVYVPEAPQQPLSVNTQTKVLDNLEVFRSSLLEYRQGVHGAKKDAKRAAKTMVRELWEQEVVARRAEKGSLECGERKSIKREVRPVKQMLKSAIWEAKAERRGHF